MLLARLEINQFGFLVPEYMGAAQYEGKAYRHGLLNLTNAREKGMLAVKRVHLTERLRHFHGRGHQRAPVDVLVFSTKPVIDVLPNPFNYDVISEEILTQNPRVVGWLKVSQEEAFVPMLIVRVGTDLKLVDNYLDQADFVFMRPQPIAQEQELGEDNFIIASGARKPGHYNKEEMAKTAFNNRMIHTQR
jgi:hypothetical protein